MRAVPGRAPPLRPSPEPEDAENMAARRWHGGRSGGDSVAGTAIERRWRIENAWRRFADSSASAQLSRTVMSKVTVMTTDLAGIAKPDWSKPMRNMCPQSRAHAAVTCFVRRGMWRVFPACLL